MYSGSNLVLASSAIRNENGRVLLRTCDLSPRYAAHLPGQPFDMMIELFKQHGLGWDKVDAGRLFTAFNPGNVNMYRIEEAGDPRLGFFGNANPILYRDIAVSGMPLRTFLQARPRSLINFVADQVIRAATTMVPLLQHVRIEDRGQHYHRLLLPASSDGTVADRVLAFILNSSSLYFGTSLAQEPPQRPYN